MSKKINQEDVIILLEKLYDQAIQGVPKFSPPIDVLAGDYLMKNDDIESAAKSFVKYQIVKCTTSGFLTGLGGLITLPIAVSANLASVIYVQMRMIAALAYMGGYNMESDQVQTLIFACLAGVSIDEILKKSGIKFGEKLAESLINKIPGSALKAINKKVGFRFITKGGETGIINLGKTVPVVGGIVGGGFDLAETSIIARRAYKLFIKGDLSVLSKEEIFEETVEETQ